VRQPKGKNRVTPHKKNIPLFHFPARNVRIYDISNMPTYWKWLGKRGKKAGNFILSYLYK